MSQNTGTLVTSAVRPNSPSDLIATAIQNEIKGGHHSYDSISSRNTIIQARREWGMLCTVYDTSNPNNTKTYLLKYGNVDTDIMNNANWVELQTGGGNGQVFDSFSYDGNDKTLTLSGPTMSLQTTLSNVVTVNTNGKIDPSVLPSLAITDTYVVSTTTSLLGLTAAEIGDVGVVTNDSDTYILSATPSSNINNWVKLQTPTSLPDIVVGAVVGSSNSIPVIEFDSKGRIIAATSTPIETKLTISEVDNSPNIKPDNLVFPNDSVYASGSNIFVNRFNGRRPITRSGYSGINLNTDDINQFLENFFFPAVPPALSLSATNTTREFGSSTLTTLNWSVTKQTRGIATINVAGNSVTVPTNINDDSDTAGSIGSGSVNTNTSINTNTTFNMSITDSVGNAFNTSVTVVYSNKRYWGRVDLTSVGNPDLTSNPSLAASVTPIITDGLILALNGAGVGSGNEFASNRNKSYNGIDGAGQYLIFAFPSSFGTPTFTVNGLPNTAFTKVRSNSPFVNASGYSEFYDVWISNTAQNAPITSLTIS